MSRKELESPEPEVAAGDGPIPADLGEDESPGKDPDRPCAEPALSHRSSLYFASLADTMEGLKQQARDVCNRLTDTRREDQTLLNGFRDNLLLKVSELTEQLDERLFRSYDFHNKLMEERLQELSEVTERSEKVHAELRHICCTLEAVYQDLCLPED
ncbi:synaptonemal complex central element protein 2 [Oenanthe melanoleuca]|uniref:synaptonemal complex central element protein 2 n=1 Tax=Oenanthe melanoleuca TaxID=2939378 RepID=UPI0024C101D9|nr:synaptonemal complex central element protein 2 [Oenanthe melanoleuca]